MAELVLSVDVAAPVETVWSALTDWERQSDWMLGTAVRPTDRNGRGVGGRREASTRLGPVGFVDSMEITAWEPPHRCAVRHTGRLVQGAGAFEVLALPDGRSRVCWSEWLQPPLGLLGQIGFLALRPLFAAGVRRSLRRFARRTEGRADTGRPLDST